MGIIIKPIVTEKLTDQGEKLNRYGFIVDRKANKLQIKSAVEQMYNVTVADVNTVNYHGKRKSRYTKAGTSGSCTSLQIWAMASFLSQAFPVVLHLSLK